MTSNRTRSAFAIAVVTLLLSGCSAIRFGGDPAPDLEGTWSGGISVEGQSLDGTLILLQSGRALDASFRAPAFGVTAGGAGEVDDEGDLWLELDYDIECPGVARMEGSLSEDGTRISGVLEAADCTGSVGGTFSFTRQ